MKWVLSVFFMEYPNAEFLSCCEISVFSLSFYFHGMLGTTHFFSYPLSSDRDIVLHLYTASCCVSVSVFPSAFVKYRAKYTFSGSLIPFNNECVIARRFG